MIINEKEICDVVEKLNDTAPYHNDFGLRVITRDDLISELSGVIMKYMPRKGSVDSAVDKVLAIAMAYAEKEFGWSEATLDGNPGCLVNIDYNR